MPIHDAQLIVRDTSDGVFVSSVPEVWALDLDGTDLKGLALHIRIPAAVTGSDPIFMVEIHAATTSAATTAGEIIAARTGMVKASEYVVPFSTYKRSVAFMFDVTSSTTTAFSIITADVIQPLGQKWNRIPEFR
jgi:hypothetical protein